MGGIPSDSTEAEIGSLSNCSPNDILSRLRIEITRSKIWVSGQELADLGLQITDVLFGPFNLILMPTFLIGMRYTQIMSGKKPAQKTPKGHEIPIPTRKDFDDVLRAAAKPAKPLPPRRPNK